MTIQKPTRTSQKKTCLQPVMIVCFICAAFISTSHVQAIHPDDDEQIVAQAPDNTTKIGEDFGGAYFVDKTLKAKSDALRSELDGLRRRMTEGKLSTDDAMSRLGDIQAELTKVKAAIEEQKTFVATLNVYRKKTEQTFQLNGGQVILTGDNLRVRGWEGEEVKCVIEKIVLAKEKPEDAEFESISVKHVHGDVEKIVGQPIEEQKRKEKEYLESEEGQELNAASRKFRHDILMERTLAQEKYIPFQGKPCDTFELSGLSYQDGNRSVSMRIESENGSTNHFSQLKRHAVLTVYLPKCKNVAIRGGMVQLDIDGVVGDLLLTRDGSTDLDYAGTFVARNISGNVLIDQVPIRSLTNVDGDVDYYETQEFVNSGTMHNAKGRTFRHYKTNRTTISQIAGDFKAWFLRSDLAIDQVKGAIDVRNEFGDTILALDDNFDTEITHRVISESGAITVRGDAKRFAEIDLFANTLCGSFFTDLDQQTLEEQSISFRTGIRPMRNWTGLLKPKGPQGMTFDRRAPMALENADRSPGLDLVSRGGSIRILDSANAADQPDGGQ